MSVKLELFRVFKTVCEHNSISDAAQQLYISQSAVSQSIKQLEQQVDTTLFTRTRKGVQLTVQGQMLYEYVSSAIDLLEAGEKKLELMKSLEFGELKIGASDTISHYLLLPKLEQFNRIYPKIKLKIINRITDEAIALIKSGKIDLAFVNLPIYDDEIEVEHYIDVQDIFVASKQSIYEGRTLSLQELAEQPLIFLEKKSNSRRYVEEWLESKGVKISPEIELGSHDLLLEFARINLGVSCVIEQFSNHYLKSGELIKVKVSDLPPKRAIGIAKRRGVSLTPSSVKFMELLQGSAT